MCPFNFNGNQQNGQQGNSSGLQNGQKGNDEFFVLDAQGKAGWGQGLWGNYPGGLNNGGKGAGAQQDGPKSSSKSQGAPANGGKGEGKGDYIELSQELKDELLTIPQLSEAFCLAFQKPPVGQDQRVTGSDGHVRCNNPACRFIHKDVPVGEWDNAIKKKAFNEKARVYRENEKRSRAPNV